MQLNQAQDRPCAYLPAVPRLRCVAWRWSRLVACLGVIAFLCGAAGPGSQAPSSEPAPPPLPSQSASQPAAAPSLPGEERTENKSLDSANGDQKRQIAAESAQLLKLATELKTEVDKTDTGTLSIPVIRKAGEIEKLARSVKQREKPGVSGN